MELPKSTCPIMRAAIRKYERRLYGRITRLAARGRHRLFPANESRQHRARPFPVRCTQFFGCNDTRFKVIGFMFEDHAAQSEGQTKQPETAHSECLISQKATFPPIRWDSSWNPRLCYSSTCRCPWPHRCRHTCDELRSDERSRKRKSCSLFIDFGSG